MNRELLIISSVGASLPEKSHSLPEDVNILIDALSSNEETIDLGAAGTAMRFCTAFFATGHAPKVLTGTDRMKARPIKDLVKALTTLGANIEYMKREGFPPIRIKPAKNIGGRVSISGAVSSQYISALLLCGHRMAEGLELKLTPPINSRPYIDLTLSILRERGVKFELSADTIQIPPQELISQNEPSL